MGTSSLTFFDTPDRLPLAAVRDQHARIDGLPLVQHVLDAVPTPAVLTNEQRQIVFANAALLTMVDPGTSAVGARLGELLDCVHAGDGPAGCGTSLACKSCGGAQALSLARTHGRAQTQECWITTRPSAARSTLSARIDVTPVAVAGERYYLVALRDTFDEQRRRALERLFLHDVLNAAGGLAGLLSHWADLTPEEAAECSRLAADTASGIVEEIESYRDLAAAERGDLAATARPVDGHELLLQLRSTYQSHEIAAGKGIVVRRPAHGGELQSDPVLLRRVLGNLLKNALEASHVDQTVTMSVEYGADGAVFSVQNSAVIPLSVQAQLFQRSFSTKAAQGRGLGTYGARLLTERYLRGKIEFESRPPSGTIFRVHVPRALAA